MKLTYHWEGDYLIPDLIPPESPHIGIWGERRRRYLLTHKKLLYMDLLFSGKLNAHLEEIDQAANAMVEQIITQLAEREGITENLKAVDQIAWVRQMNSIRHRAEEIIRTDLIETTFIKPF